MIELTRLGDVDIVLFGTPCINSVSGIDQITRELRQFVETARPQKLVVDFDGVKFFSSQVLGLMVDIWRRMKNYGGIVIISGIDPQLNRVFRITNLDKIFKFYPDRDTALEALAGA